MPLTLTNPIAGAAVASRDFVEIRLRPRDGTVAVDVIDIDAQGNVLALNPHTFASARAHALIVANVNAIWTAYQAEVAGNAGTVT